MKINLIIKMAYIFESLAKKVNNNWENEYSNIENFENKIQNLAEQIRNESIKYFNFPLIIEVSKIRKENINGIEMIISLPKELRSKSRKNIDLEKKYYLRQTCYNVRDVIWSFIEKFNLGFVYRINEIGEHDDADYFGYYYKFEFFPKKVQELEKLIEERENQNYYIDEDED